jgi:hypothetical protein
MNAKANRHCGKHAVSAYDGIKAYFPNKHGEEDSSRESGLILHVDLPNTGK